MRKALTQPKIVIPVLLSIALLAFLFSISDVPGVLHHIDELPLSIIGATFVLALMYLAMKLVLWRSFMNDLHIPTTWRQLVLAFAVGEMTLSLPAGVYAQNWVLRRIAGADFSRSAAATSAVLVVEGGVTLAAVAALGIPGWDWLRTTILTFFLAASLVVTALVAFAPVRNSVSRLLQAGPLRTIGPEFLDMIDGMVSLAKPRFVALAIPLTAGYLFMLVVAFFLVTIGVGIDGFTLRQAASIYLFALGVVLLSPISSHLGIVEASGVGAMQAWGYNASQAFAALLGFRLVWTGAIWAACMPLVFFLRKEFEAESPAGQDAKPAGGAPTANL